MTVSVHQMDSTAMAAERLLGAGSCFEGFPWVWTFDPHSSTEEADALEGHSGPSASEGGDSMQVLSRCMAHLCVGGAHPWGPVRTRDPCVVCTPKHALVACVYASCLSESLCACVCMRAHKLPTPAVVCVQLWHHGLWLCTCQSA